MKGMRMRKQRAKINNILNVIVAAAGDDRCHICYIVINSNKIKKGITFGKSNRRVRVCAQHQGHSTYKNRK